MTVVEGPHGRDQAHQVTCRASVADRGAHIDDRSHDPHAAGSVAASARVLAHSASNNGSSGGGQNFSEELSTQAVDTAPKGSTDVCRRPRSS